MALKRIVDTRFWTDDKIVELFSPEDKLFMLYILTNPHTTQLGIYKINKKIMAFELGYSLETIQVLLDRFETKYKIIIYSNETNEIAIKNYLKYSVIKGGKPVEDCLLKEIKQIKNKKLIDYVFNNIKNDSNINETINKIINIYYNNIYNNIYSNNNDNDNEVSLTYRERIVNEDAEDEPTIYDFLQENGFILSPIHYEIVSLWEDNELTRHAIKQAVMNNKYNIKYIQSILNSYKRENIKTVQQAIEREEQFNKNKNYKKESDIPEWFNIETENTELNSKEREEFDKLLEEMGE